jgi:hypothetical protein
LTITFFDSFTSPAFLAFITSIAFVVVSPSCFSRHFQQTQAETVSKMHFSVLSTLVLVTTVIAAPIDISTKDSRIITAAAIDVTNNLERLGRTLAAIRNPQAAYNLTPYQRDIETSAAELTNSFQNSGRNIRGAPVASIVEATALISTINSLDSATTTTTNAWMDAKSIIVRVNGGRSAAIRMLEAHDRASAEFSNALLSKMPTAYQGTARIFREKIMNEAKRAMAAYQSTW